MTKTFPDGTVELGYGSNLPPGRAGQHVARNYVWFRVDENDWERAPSNTMHKNMQALECADSVAEFRQYLEIV